MARITAEQGTNLDAAVSLLVDELYGKYPSRQDIERVLRCAMDHQSLRDEFRVASQLEADSQRIEQLQKESGLWNDKLDNAEERIATLEQELNEEVVWRIRLQTKCESLEVQCLSRQKAHGILAKQYENELARADRAEQQVRDLREALMTLAKCPLPNLPPCWCEVYTIGDEGQIEHDARCRTVLALLSPAEKGEGR